jgi:hypothetical protein
VKLETLNLADWRKAADAAAQAVGATEVLAIRAGGLLVPANLPARVYAPQSGAKLLRAMIRARILSAQEAGHVETNDGLMALGRKQGLMLAAG